MSVPRPQGSVPGALKNELPGVDCLFFGHLKDGCQCAVAASAVHRVDDLIDAADVQFSLESIGFSDSTDFQSPRILRVLHQGRVASIVLRTVMTARSVPSEELFPLPERPFGESLFSVLISSDVHGQALLLDPERLLNFYLTYSTPAKAQ